MTMPHLMNCSHSEESWAWCLDCVKEIHDELERERIEAGKYERCLSAAAQRLQDVYSLKDVKVIGLLEVPNVIDELIAERDALRADLKRARADAVEKTVACAVVRGKLLLFSDAETFRKWIKANPDGGYLAWVDGVEIVPADMHKCG